MRIQIACVRGPGIELLVTVDVAAGSTVADALRSAAIAQRTGSVPDADGLAIFGRRVDGSTRLREGDRIEITRPLLRDPKAARRDRAGCGASRPSQARRRRRSGI